MGMKRERDEGEEEVPTPLGGDEKRVKADEEPAPATEGEAVVPAATNAVAAHTYVEAAVTPAAFAGYVAPEEHRSIALRARLLIGNKEAGIVIGKGGVNIGKLRQDFGVEVEPANVQNKRVCVISGTADKVTSCVLAVVDMLAPSLSEESADGEVQHHMTLLVGNEVIGSVIGKGGAVINATRQNTGAHIKVSQQALDNSSEKTVEVKAGVAIVKDTFVRILGQIITMEKDGEVPTTKVEWGSAQSTAAPQGPPSSYGGGYAQAGYQQHQQQQQQQPNYYGGGGGGGASAQGERRSVVIPVASGLVGSLIGRGGHIIKSIRETSGAEVRIADVVPGSDQRNVTITGTDAQTPTAVNMVYEALGQPSPYASGEAAAAQPTYAQQAPAYGGQQGYSQYAPQAGYAPQAAYGGAPAGYQYGAPAPGGSGAPPPPGMAGGYY